MIPTIQNFHNTSMYYGEYENERIEFGKSFERGGGDAGIYIKRKSLCSIIPVDQLPVRIVHNDTKLNNVLLDEKPVKESQSLIWIQSCLDVPFMILGI